MMKGGSDESLARFLWQADGDDFSSCRSKFFRAGREIALGAPELEANKLGALGL